MYFKKKTTMFKGGNFLNDLQDLLFTGSYLLISEKSEVEALRFENEKSLLL